MIPDQLLRLASSLNLASTPAPATLRNSDVIDIDTLRDIGSGVALYLRIQVDENVRAAATQSGGTVFYTVYGDDSSLSNPVYVSSLSSNWTDTTGLTAGQVFYIPIPPLTINTLSPSSAVSIPNGTKKYFGVVIGGYGNNYVTGKLTIDIVTEVNRTEKTYSKGFTVQ